MGLGDSGTGAVVEVVVVVCRYQKGQWKSHEHLYNKAIKGGLNISQSDRVAPAVSVYDSFSKGSQNIICDHKEDKQNIELLN